MKKIVIGEIKLDRTFKGTIIVFLTNISLWCVTLISLKCGFHNLMQIQRNTQCDYSQKGRGSYCPTMKIISRIPDNVFLTFVILVPIIIACSIVFIVDPLCEFNECCAVKYLPYNMSKFNEDLKLKLVGQPLVMQLSDILEGHLANLDAGTNEKPLVLSFDGWTGVGKNYVASIIANAFYTRGTESGYFKIYMGEYHFPRASRVDEYKEQLKKEVSAIVKSCHRAMIVFDEVHKMPSGVLDALMPMMSHYTSVDGVDYRSAIFIFISNIGSAAVAKELLKLYDNGYTRQDTTMAHFEPSIRNATYNTGGLRGASVVFQHLIDHYIPFLPLEQVHVEKCTRIAFAARGVPNPTPEMIDEAMSINTYGPLKEKPIFVNAGCKRVQQQVNKVIAAHSKGNK